MKLSSQTPQRGSAKGTAFAKARADRFAANIGPVIADIQKSGVTILRGLAKTLKVRGIPTDRGGTWDARTVANVLRRIRAP